MHRTLKPERETGQEHREKSTYLGLLLDRERAIIIEKNEIGIKNIFAAHSHIINPILSNSLSPVF